MPPHLQIASDATATGSLSKSLVGTVNPISYRFIFAPNYRQKTAKQAGMRSDRQRWTLMDGLAAR